MLPAHPAENIRKQVLFYLQSTFDFREKSIEKAFERFLTDPDSGLFKGPWVQLRRPFRPADAKETVPFNLHVPYVCGCGNGHAFLLRNPTMPQESVTLVAVRESSGRRPATLMFRELIGLAEGSDDL
jgi:DEAD/DEAH box helicase domain-containing protein